MKFALYIPFIPFQLFLQFPIFFYHMMEANPTVSQFPHISKGEFETACEQLVQLFTKHESKNHSDWVSVEIIHRDGDVYLRIQKELSIPSSGSQSPDIPSSEADEIEEDEEDEAELRPGIGSPQTVIQYDIILSPAYSLPTLYFSLLSPNPTFSIPSLDTLYTHIIPVSFTNQTSAVGVIGGVTITDHPITHRPVYFIHPCQTAAVLRASVEEGKKVEPLDYLVLWMGAMGSCVGLSVPVGLVTAPT